MDLEIAVKIKVYFNLRWNSPSKHSKCVGGTYQKISNAKRFDVPNEYIPWNLSWAGYNPPEFTSEIVLKGPEWADPDISGKYPSALPKNDHSLKFNQIDGKINRKSHMGVYELHHVLPR